mgnify:CR=1 FL=1
MLSKITFTEELKNFTIDGLETHSNPKVADPRENPIFNIEPSKAQISANYGYGWCAMLATINSVKAMVRDHPKLFKRYSDVKVRDTLFNAVCCGT